VLVLHDLVSRIFIISPSCDHVEDYNLPSEKCDFLIVGLMKAAKIQSLSRSSVTGGQKFVWRKYRRPTKELPIPRAVQDEVSYNKSNLKRRTEWKRVHLQPCPQSAGPSHVV
jgi:hypothetical protein